MKISKIKAICQDTEDCVLAKVDGNLMIGTGTALFSTDGAEITEKEIPGIFNLDEKQQKKMQIRTVDLDMGTEICEMKPCKITVTGLEEFIPLEDEAGEIYFIRQKFADACRGKAEYRRYSLNARYDGTPIICIRDGMDKPSAYIAPIGREQANLLMHEMAHIGCASAGGYMEPVEPEDGQQTSMVE